MILIGHGGLLRTISLARPIRGSGKGIYHRHAKTAGDLGFSVQFNAETRAAPLYSGRIVPRVTIRRVTPFIPRERPNVIKHAIAGYLRLPRPTPAHALFNAGAALALLLSESTRVCHWQSN